MKRVHLKTVCEYLSRPRTRRIQSGEIRPQGTAFEDIPDGLDLSVMQSRLKEDFWTITG